MLNFVWSLPLGLLVGICAQTADAAEGKEGFGKPALIATTDLADFDALPEDRRKLIEGAIAVARDSPWLPYTPGGADPSQGGFDCSGAMYFVLRKAGLDPPRSAAEQLRWLKSNERLHEVPRDAMNLEHPSLKKLRPGDLLFWGTPGSADERRQGQHHARGDVFGCREKRRACGDDQFHRWPLVSRDQGQWIRRLRLPPTAVRGRGRLHGIWHSARHRGNVGSVARCKQRQTRK